MRARRRATPRTPTRAAPRRGAVVGLCLLVMGLVVLAPSALLLHLTWTPHAVCEAHGQLIHVDAHGAAHDAAADRLSGAPRDEAAHSDDGDDSDDSDDSDEEHAHESCANLAPSSAAVALTLTRGVAPPPAARVLRSVERLRPQDPRAPPRYLIAPKQSPPQPA